MSTTLTVRIGQKLHRALEQRAGSLGKTLSELVCEILEEAVAEWPLAERTRHLKGHLEELPEPADEWRQQLTKRNWRR